MKRLIRRQSPLVLMAIVLIASSPAGAVSRGPKATKVVTYTATEDATVSSARPNANFGEGLRLSVRSHDPVLQTYLRFDLHRPIDPGRIVGALGGTWSGYVAMCPCR